MNDELLMQLLAQAPARKRRGCVASTIEFLCTVAVVALAVVGGYFLLEIWVGTPAAPQGTNKVFVPSPTVSVYTETQRQQQPVVAPAPSLPDCAAVQDTVTACERDDFASARREVDPTPTPEPTPTATGFWTQEEIAAFTATAEAFYNPETLPTAPPAFATAVQAGCEDAAKRAQSPLLDSWCKPLDE